MSRVVAFVFMLVAGAANTVSAEVTQIIGYPSDFIFLVHKLNGTPLDSKKFLENIGDQGRHTILGTQSRGLPEKEDEFQNLKDLYFSTQDAFAKQDVLHRVESVINSHQLEEAPTHVGFWTSATVRAYNIENRTFKVSVMEVGRKNYRNYCSHSRMNYTVADLGVDNLDEAKKIETLRVRRAGNFPALVIFPIQAVESKGAKTCITYGRPSIKVYSTIKESFGPLYEVPDEKDLIFQMEGTLLKGAMWKMFN